MRVRLLLSGIMLGFVAWPCAAQSDPAATANTPSANPPASTTADPLKPKKVWTNEDLPSAKSAAVPRGQANQSSGGTPKADTATVERIRKNLQQLQNQLDDVEKKLKSYNEFLAGEAVSTDARDMGKGVVRTPVDQQVAQLKDKKKKLEDQIGDLYDDARKKGIDPGQLR